MAVALNLSRKEDFLSQVSVISLLGGTDGIDLDYYGGWTPGIAQGNGLAPVSETINLIISGSSNDNLAANVQSLDDKLKETGWYNNERMETRATWLQAQLSNETNQRQALIYSIAGSLGESILSPYTDDQSVMRKYTLALTRAPWWERPDEITRNFTIANLFGAVDAYVVGGAIPGDVPARIGRMDLRGVSGGGGPLTEFWIGFRTDRFGPPGNFWPIWDLANASGTLGTATSRTADGTAHGANRLTVAYQGNSDDDMNTRITLTTDDITVNYDDQRGAYIILLRAKVTSGEWRVRLQDGPEGAADATWRTQDRVSIDSTNWFIHELGTVRLPPQRWRVAECLQKYAMRVQAELVSGTGDLHLDALSLIPYAEGAIHLYINGTGVQYSGGDLDPAKVRTYPNEDVEGWWYDASVPAASIDVQALNWGLPVGDWGYTVATAQRADSHTLTDDVDMYLYLFPRWRTLRGAD